MYVTTGNIDSLLKWFHKDYNPTKFLCLLVAGHLHDAEFFRKVFDSQEAIDVISGEDVAVFLFANGQDGSLTLEVNGGTGEIVPGELLIPGHSNWLWYQHISEIQMEEIRNDVIRASQYISHQITSYFQLATDDIPCILLIVRDDSEPWVIRTKGEADVQTFFSFLKELRILASSLPTTYDLQWPMGIAQSILTEEEVTLAKKAVETSEVELQSALDELIDVLERYGMSRAAGEALFNLDTATKVWEMIGFRKDIPQPASATQYTKIFAKAVEEGELKEKCRNVVRSARSLERARRRLKKHKNAVFDLRRWGMGKKRTTRESVEDLCKKFERKFTWKSRVRPLKKFAEAFIGITKKTNELLSVQENIMKLLK